MSGGQEVVFEFSAGGVVRRAGEVLLVWTKDLKGRQVVTLPKGLGEPRETSEAAASREERAGPAPARPPRPDRGRVSPLRILLPAPGPAGAQGGPLVPRGADRRGRVS